MSSDNQYFESGTEFIIARNIESLLNIILEDIGNFKQKNILKAKSFSSLSIVISKCGYLISPEYYTKTGGIFANIFKYINSEEEIIKGCEKCAQAIGQYTNQEILIPLIIKSINELELSTAHIESLYVRIKFIANYMNKLENITIDNAKKLLKCLETLDIFNLPNFQNSEDFLFNYSQIFHFLIIHLKENCKSIHENIFFPLLILNSLPETSKFRENIGQSLKKFAENCGLSLEELYSFELGNVLERFKKTYKSWTKNSPDRFAFDLYVKIAGVSLEKHWTDVLLIISQCCESEKDIEIRMDMIILLDKIICQKDLHEQIKNYIDFIFPEILFPSCAWRAGRPLYKVRKATVVDMIHVYQNNLISGEQSLNFFSDFMTIFKNILEDDWDAELRYLGIQLTKHFLINTKDTLKYDHISEMYDLLLKRLDDSQDSNRILICEVLSIFSSICLRLKLSPSILEFILDHSFVHLDDQNSKVREAVSGFLEKISEINREVFLKILVKNESAFTHKSELDELKKKVEEKKKNDKEG